MDAFFILILTVFLTMGVGSCSYDLGKQDLCKKQFSGEMHDDKCVKVQREEIK